MKVYLVRHAHRSWGFKINAVVASSEYDALQFVCDKHGAQTINRGKHHYAEVVGECALENGAMAEFTFEE